MQNTNTTNLKPNLPPSKLEGDELDRLRKLCAGRADGYFEPGERVWEWKSWVPRLLRRDLAFKIPLRYVFMKQGAEVRFHSDRDSQGQAHSTET